MYLPGPFAVPIGSFQQPIKPPTVDPFEGPLRYIPINCEWLPYIAGALTQLLLQATWDTGGDVDALFLAQNRASDLISLISCEQLPTIEQLCGSMGAGGDCDMGCCLRFQNGVLQQLNCGVWEDVAGQADGMPTPPLQPANGAPQPAAGGCDTYHATMIGSQRWLVPTPVSTGDQINVSNLDGATVEDPDILWFGPNGLIFFGGAYQPGTGGLSGSDPVPTALHQSLVISVGGNFYSLLGGTFTIPAGVSNEQPVIILNTSTPANLIGTVNFDIQVCNNSTPTWSHTWDFTLEPGPWQPESDSIVTNGAVWVPGVGWSWTNQALSGGSAERIAAIQLDPIAFAMDTLDFQFDRTMGTIDSTATSGQNLVINTSVVDAETWASLTSGVALHYQWLTPTVVTSRIAVILGCSNKNVGPTTDGSVVITRATITGHGSDPFA